VTELDVDHLTVSRGSCRVLDDVSLKVSSRERVAIIGPNGAGKTTLLRAILGLLPAENGRVLLDSVSTWQLSPMQRAAMVAWLPQQALAQEPITALDFVQAARFRFRESDHAARDASLLTLKRVGADQWAHRLITRLSGGEQQRVALAALFAQEATLLLADEPANHLDPAQQVSAWRLLAAAACNCAVVVITHDINLVPLLGDALQTRIVALNRGRVEFDVPASDPSLPERLCRLYGIGMQAFGQAGRRVIVPTAVTESAP
jgi:iron complex transport system ATP-binding protein